MINKYYEINIYKDFLHIKNYNKIEDINYNNIIVLLINKKIIVSGNNLIINKLDEYELTIKGNIKEIKFIDE